MADRAQVVDVARALHRGASWKELADALGEPGPRLAKRRWRPHTSPLIAAWCNQRAGEGDPPHGTRPRYWQTTTSRGDPRPCYPDGRTCDACLHAQADYQQRVTEQEAHPVDERLTTSDLDRIAGRIHAGATWEQLADELGVTSGHLREHIRPAVQGRLLALVERDQPSTTHRTHGTYVKYTIDRCRCEPCRYAAVVESHDLEQRHRRGDVLVDAEPVRDHVASLQARGMGWKRVARAAGVSTGSMWKLLYGVPSEGRPPCRHVRPATAEAILAVEPQLADGARVEADVTKAQLRRLRERGWTWRALGERLDRSASNLSGVLRRDYVTSGFAREVARLYREQLVPPPDAVRQPGGHAKAKAEREGASAA